MADTDLPLFLAELVVYDPALPGTKTLRYASRRGLITTPAETPASTLYDARILQPVDITRDLVADGTTQGAARVGFGKLVIDNRDGALDALADYGFDGRAAVIRYGLEGAAYPGGFTAWTFTMEQPQFDADTITIELRDRILEVQVPLQTTRYAGNNTLPVGLEGVADLKDKPKPVCLGRVKNVQPPCVNTSKLIFQVNDGAVASLDAVYDAGVKLAATVLAWTSVVWGITTCQGIAYGAGLWVAVGDAGKVYTSPDGTTWTSRTSTFGANAVYGIVWSGSLFVIVGAAGNLATSPDGVTWTSRTSSFVATHIYGVTWGNGLFVATGQVVAAGAGKIATSADGITWTQRTSNLGVGNDGLCASFGGGTFVVGGAGGKIVSSPDGTTWTSRTNPFGAGNSVIGTTWGDGVFVAVGTAGVTASSVNGVDWIQRYLGALTTVQSCVVYGAGWYIVGGASYLFVSRDAVSWVPVGTADTFTGIGTDGNGNFRAGGNGSSVWAPTNSGGTYANATDLQDDTLAPVAGTWKIYLAGGYFRLGSSPFGLITADVTQGATAGDRKPGATFSTLLTRAGRSAPDWSAADVTAADALGYILGFFAGVDVSPNVNEVLDQVAASIGGWWGLDRTGIYRLKQLVAPSGTAVLAITANELRKKPQRVLMQDPGHGLPVWRVTIQHTRNWTVQTDGLAAFISDADRALLAQEYQTAKYETSSVKTKHLLSPELTIPTLLTSATDALTEATRQQTLRGTRRDPYELVLQLNSETAVLDLADVVDFTYAPNGATRYGLSGPKKMLALGVLPDAKARTLTLTVWG